jgi:hypothetical protein
MVKFLFFVPYFWRLCGLATGRWLSGDIQATIFKQYFKQYFTEIWRVPMNKENLTIHFKVKDFNAWRTGYDGHEKDRVSAGITNGRVFRSANDPNDVVILQDVADVAKARTWLGSTEMKTVMEKSGVLGSPSLRFAAAA